MTTALYRRYRPETFEDVIGQEHVTEPLMTALRKNRVNHAYLFSGPRGCGKTTSARILARCLNCAQGPTATPCGQCESCRDLARDGAGSLDVIEMDAASHGGVDHARDLRERATFAPVRDRFKIFIIDEAHMVTREGFNALLKIVEEPPEHVKFIFATTEPSKVLTTIRSRTHHYPFRLVPPEPLMRYLEQLCQEEGVTTEPGVLSLVVRAGGGSVRDSLSVLDQLMAGSDERGLTYDLAVALLGYTHAALLDDVVDAFAAGDAATVFSSVDRVVQTGQDPRRFVEDLLERFRDLVVVNAVPDSAANILHGMPTDQINRLRNQATQLGAAELSRSADITNEALNEMTGATSPQLHLELLCARILLPSADHTTRGITSRVDRLERRLSIPRGAGIRQGAQDGDVSAPGAEPTPPTPSAAPGPVRDAAPARTPSPPGGAVGPETSSAPRASSSPQPAEPGRTAEPVRGNGPADETGEETVETGPALSRPVRQDGSEPGRPAFETPDVAEPSEPEDESEEPQGSGHPAAADPVPEDERGPAGEHPPADGTTTDVEAGQSGTAAPSVPTEQQDDVSSTGTEDSRVPSPASGEQQAPARASERDDRVASGSGEAAAPSDVTSGELELLRSSWPEIVSALAGIRRVAWAITVRGTPISFENNTLRVAFEGDGDIMNFPRFEGDVRTAIQTVVGLDCAVEAVRPGDTRGRQNDDGAGGPPSGPGRGQGPGRGPGPGRGGPNSSLGSEWGGAADTEGSSDRGAGGNRGGSAASDAPDYFREPEGFGVNRHRNVQSAPASTPATAHDRANEHSQAAEQGAHSAGTSRAERMPEQGPQDGGAQSAGVARGQEQTRAQNQDRAAARPTGSHQENGRPGRSAPAPSPADDEPVTSWSVAPIPQPGDAVPDTADSETSAREKLQTDATGSAGESTVAAHGGPDTASDAPAAPTDGAVAPAASADPAGESSEHSSGERENPQSIGLTGTTDQKTERAERTPSGSPHESPRSSDRALSYERGPEYWSPEEPPPPPEDEPPADMYDEPGPAPSSYRAPSAYRAPSGTDGNGAASGDGHGTPGAGAPTRGPGAADTGPHAPAAAPGAAPGTSRPGWRERHAAAIAAAGRASADTAPPSTRSPGVDDETFVPGADDESLEDSSLYGRAAIERILGGMLIDERAHDTTQ